MREATTPTSIAAAEVRERNERRCERLLGRSELLDTTGIDFDAVADIELEPEVIDVLVYMRDVEGFTTRYLDGFAGHPSTRRDRLVGRFLGIWQAEEGAHAEAIDRFLRSYTDGRGLPYPAQQDPPPSRPPLLERIMVRLTMPLGHVVTATHMAWGATNELLTLNGYRLLAERTDHPQLRELLTRIAAQESRHYAFYLLQTEWRLRSSRLARRIVPALMRKTWTPVGVGDGYKSRGQFDDVLEYLMGAPSGPSRVAAMDETVRRLPGCEDLTLYAVALQPQARAA